MAGPDLVPDRFKRPGPSACVGVLIAVLGLTCATEALTDGRPVSLSGVELVWISWLFGADRRAPVAEAFVMTMLACLLTSKHLGGGTESLDAGRTGGCDAVHDGSPHQ
jgi:hypothetical protein